MDAASVARCLCVDSSRWLLLSNSSIFRLPYVPKPPGPKNDPPEPANWIPGGTKVYRLSTNHSRSAARSINSHKTNGVFGVENAARRSVETDLQVMQDLSANDVCPTVTCFPEPTVSASPKSARIKRGKRHIARSVSCSSLISWCFWRSTRPRCGLSRLHNRRRRANLKVKNYLRFGFVWHPMIDCCSSDQKGKSAPPSRLGLPPKKLPARKAGARSCLLCVDDVKLQNSRPAGTSREGVLAPAAEPLPCPSTTVMVPRTNVKRAGTPRCAVGSTRPGSPACFFPTPLRIHRMNIKTHETPRCVVLPLLNS